MKNQIWELNVSTIAKRRDWKYGEIKSLTTLNGKNSFNTILDFFPYKDDLINLDIVKEVEVEIKDRAESNPFPDLMHIYGYSAANERAMDFFQSEGLEYKSKQIKFINSVKTYKLVVFPANAQINHIASNTEFNKNELVTKGHNNFVFSESRIVFQIKRMNNLKIIRVIELPTRLICVDEIKRKIEKMKLTGIYFSELQVIEEDSVSISYIAK